MQLGPSWIGAGCAKCHYVHYWELGFVHRLGSGYGHGFDLMIELSRLTLICMYV